MIFPFVLSTFPFALALYGAINFKLNPNSFDNNAFACDLNVGALSDKIASGNSSEKVHFINAKIHSAVDCDVVGINLTYPSYKSIMTKMFLYPCFVTGSGPIKSIATI